MTGPLAAIELRGVGKSFGGNKALEDLNLAAQEGEITSLIGPNGCGKSTTLNLITGVFRVDAGSVLLHGHEITGRPTHVVARMGVVRTFQTPHLFPGMTVMENALAGAHRLPVPSLALQALGFDRLSRIDRERREQAQQLLSIAGLEIKIEHDASTLSTGEQKLLDLCRALMAQPTVLLLDEPAAGLNDDETHELGVFLDAIRGAGLTLVFVEHNLGLVKAVSDRVHVLRDGRSIFSGTPAELSADKGAVDAFLGNA
jgi:ABC-type branched-subunit amino acid transport system ATPase component